MSNIFLNGLNSKVGGGKSILNNYLDMLFNEHDTKDHFFVLTPNKVEYEQYDCNHITIIDIKNIYKKLIFFPFTNRFVLPRVIKKTNIDKIFNLSDVPIPVNVPQVFLFDWSYAVYENRISLANIGFMSYTIFIFKLYFFKKYLKYVSVLIAQTKTMKKRLEEKYFINNIEVIPNAVTLENISGGEVYNFNLPKGRKLLYLSHYYPHKNFEIFIPLALKIKKNHMNCKIIITIDKKQNKMAKELLDNIEKHNLQDIIYNIGPVDMKYVPSLYQQSDGLLMPTLLESYGLPYIEAMQNKKTILTSDLDFAHDVCQDAAFYFDPNSIDSILKSIEIAFADVGLKQKKIDNGTKIVSNVLAWKDVLYRYNELLDAL